MRKVNVDSKILTLGLCLVVVCIFTLTIAYAALNAVLTISGNAEVVSSTWDIYLTNPKVVNGSVSSDVPVIKSKCSVEFSVVLNMPGDYYEFTVDVVNNGTIDAMIENIIKTPELTTEQARFLKYEVSYQNGESIDTKQLLEKETAMPIKVRIEYRNDLVSSDLPTGQVVLDLALTLEYIQSDGNTNNVIGNGKIIYANGNIDDIGTVVTIGSEQFYTIGTDGDNVKLLSMYNLYVGGYYDDSWHSYGDEATGMQDSSMLGYISQQPIRNGTVAFSNKSSSYIGSIVENYVNTYKILIESKYNVDVVDARLITKEELTSSETFACVEKESCSNEYSWIYSTSYWTSSANGDGYVWYILSDGSFDLSSYNGFYDSSYFGVRPVITISKDYF